MSRLKTHAESHLVARIGWLRAAVLLEWLRLQCPGQQSLR